MRIFGISLTSIAVLVLFFYLGTRFPNSFNRVPVIG